MIIECICGEKKFEVSPELIPASGRTIKCGSCDKIWFYKPENLENENQVDGKSVPIPHFGLILEWDTFTNFAKNLKAKGVKFVIEPYIRFEGQAGEQATMFFKDPSGNALEFKSFKDHDQIFAT